MLLSGRKLTAQEACAKGLVSQVLWPGTFMQEVTVRIRELVSCNSIVSHSLFHLMFFSWFFFLFVCMAWHSFHGTFSHMDTVSLFPLAFTASDWRTYINVYLMLSFPNFTMFPCYVISIDVLYSYCRLTWKRGGGLCGWILHDQPI